MGRGSKPGERRGGRKKGTLNKRTVLFTTVKAACEAQNLNPAELMAEIATARKRGQNLDLRFRAAAELLQYMAPKLTRAEMTGAGGGPIQQGPVQIRIEYVDAIPIDNAAVTPNSDEGED